VRTTIRTHDHNLLLEIHTLILVPESKYARIFFENGRDGTNRTYGTNRTDGTGRDLAVPGDDGDVSDPGVPTTPEDAPAARDPWCLRDLVTLQTGRQLAALYR
jgi:hypothetical protein